MLFNSLEFIFFLPVVIFIYFILPRKIRWGFLLLSSYFFYMYWKVEYIFLLIVSTLIDYFAALKMTETSDRKKRRPYLMLSIIANLGLLFAFKYYNFFANNLNFIFHLSGIATGLTRHNLLLPVGISFYTFQTLGYSIDVYRGKMKAEKHPGIYALFVSFFPQLVAGPIERGSSLLPQLKKNHSFCLYRLLNGGALKGTVKKIKYRSDETTILLGKGTPGEWMGIAEVIMNSVYLYDVLAQESVEVLAFTKHNFHLLLQNSSIKQIILKELARSLYLLHGQLELNQPLHILQSCFVFLYC